MKSKILLLLLLPTFLMVHFKSAAQTVPASDSLALVNLYDSTGGSTWTTHTNWLTKKAVSTWYGVTVSGGRVTQLQINENNMGGSNATDSLPWTLGNLSALQVISFQINNLTGSIPASLGNLTNLEVLELNGNQLTDTLPASLGNLSKLQYFLVGYEGDGNLIQGSIPSSFGNLTNLTILDLDNNGFTGTIPASLSSLTNLTYLDLDGNLFSGSIPSYIGTFSALNYLDLNTNLFTGTIPASISNLTNLTYLDFYDNSLTGSIPSLSNLTNLTNLDLGFNQLTGTLPSTLGNLTTLNLLSLGYNNITGSIPSTLGNLSVLTYLDLSSDQLSDSIPSTLDDLSSLTVFQIPNNQFTFSGMEGIATAYSFALYAPQANIPIHQNGNVLSVSAGGTLSNNTYDWYKNDVLLSAITGDSTLTVTTIGTYQVVVNNAIATTLTLYSDSIVLTALPVKLLNFTGALQKNKVNLNWKTTNEVNAQSYIVERSTDGVNFTPIGSLAAIDLSAETNNYAFTDLKPVAGGNYYRLKMVDKDGQFTYSNIVLVHLNASAFALSVYPNPAVSTTTVSFTEAVAGKYTIEVSDVSGKLLSLTNGVSTVGANNVNIDCSNYASGTYFVTFIDDANGTQTLKLTK